MTKEEFLYKYAPLNGRDASKIPVSEYQTKADIQELSKDLDEYVKGLIPRDKEIAKEGVNEKSGFEKLLDIPTTLTPYVLKDT